MTPRYTNPLFQAAHDDAYAYRTYAEVEDVLPPGVSRADFESALAELRAVVGREAVYASGNLDEYVDAYETPESGPRKVPGGAVCPSSVQQVQEVLKVVNKYKVPVWTVSRGKNLGYGGPAPVVSGSIVLDLHRMNKIIEVNEKFQYAVVEPGVTFWDLYDHCAKNKLKVWPSVASVGWGSVMGNTLDRGMGFVPTAHHHEHITDLEVVLPTGADMIRTGQFASTVSPSAHLTRYSFGPSLDGLFLQSNLGVVTKMAIHLTPQPQAYMACTFHVPTMEDVAPVVDVFGALRRAGTLPHTVYVVSLGEWIMLVKPRAEWWGGEGPIPEWREREIMQEMDLGYWNVHFGLYGAPGVIQAQFDEVRRVVERDIPQGKLRGQLFTPTPSTSSTGTEDALLPASSVPESAGGGIFVGVASLFSLPMTTYYNRATPGPGSTPSGAHGAYSPILPLEGRKVLEWARAARAVYEREGRDMHGDFFLHDRHAVFVCMLCFDKSDAGQRAGTERIFRGLYEEGRRRGLAEYRAHVKHMDLIADMFDFNDHAYRRFVETLKDALDPNGILSPGKQGIWPKRLREMMGMKDGGPRDVVNVDGEGTGDQGVAKQVLQLLLQSRREGAKL